MAQASFFALLALAAATFLAGCFHSTDSEPQADSEQPLAEPPAPGNPVVLLETSKGDIVVELWPDKAPQTVESFLSYVDNGHYDGTVFHRVIKGFMVQGGGFTPDMKQKPTGQPVPNEASASVPNDRGTLAMARTSDPHSATAQFFINHADNDFLNHRDKTPQGYGYCVFGEVIEGMDVVDAIAVVKTTTMGPYQDVPAEELLIVKAKRH